jgi:hypothetical protein
VCALPTNQLMPAASARKSPAATPLLGGPPGENEQPHPLRRHKHPLHAKMGGENCGRIRKTIRITHCPAMVVAGPQIQSWARRRVEEQGRSPEDVTPGGKAVLVLGTFLVGIYGGYFTAAQGILLVGVMGASLPESVQRMNAAKNLLTLVVNVVCGGWLYVGGLPSDQLARCRNYRSGLAGRGTGRGTLWPSAVAKCVARHDHGSWSHRVYRLLAG